MKRYEKVSTTMLNMIEQECFGIQRQLAYQHSFGVASLCIYHAKIRGLDTELAGCIGVLHDYARFYTGSSFDHAPRGALFVKDLLRTLGSFEEEEITIITTAIKNHSSKEQIDDSYSELIKDCDLLYNYLSEPEQVFSKEVQERLQKLL